MTRTGSSTAEGERAGGGGDSGSRPSGRGRRIQPAAVFDSRRPRDPHDRLLQGLPAALSLVSQPGEPLSRAGGGGRRGPLYQLRSAWQGIRRALKIDAGTVLAEAVESLRSSVAVCPTGARELVGRWWTVAEVLSATLRDRLFFDGSGGGVTFSGGEPLAQPLFLEHCLGRRARRESTPPSTPLAVARGSRCSGSPSSRISSSTTSSRSSQASPEIIGVPFEQVIR